MSDTVNIKAAAALLGVSARKVYDLAAPDGPIPCYRIGRRITFNRQDILDYQESCRFTATKREVASSLNSTAVSMARGSGLEKLFQKHGIKPRLTPTTGKKARSSTPSRPASNVLSIQSRTLLPST